MGPTLNCINTLLTSQIKSFVDIFGKKNVKHLLLFFFFYIRGFENNPSKALTLQLQGGSSSNMDQYTT